MVSLLSKLPIHRIAGTPYNSIFSNTVTDVKSNGTVSYMNFVTLKSMCVSQLRDFPRDHHECYVTLDSIEALRLRLMNQDGVS